jgi:hypothetical protein
MFSRRKIRFGEKNKANSVPIGLIYFYRDHQIYTLRILGEIEKQRIGQQRHHRFKSDEINHLYPASFI